MDRTTLNDLSYETSGGENPRMPSRRAASRRQRSTSRPSSLMPRSIRFCAPASFPIKEGARTRSAVNATCSSIRTGVVIAHQTFGDMLRWNPHFHAIVLEGGFDEQGTFVYIPLGHLQAMTELLRRRVVALLVDQTCTSSTLWTSLPSSEITCGNSTAHPTGAGATHSSLWFVLLADQGSLDPHALRSAAGAIRLHEPR